MPVTKAGEEDHAVPLDVSTFPAVPGEDSPVPPDAAAKGVVKANVPAVNVAA